MLCVSERVIARFSFVLHRDIGSSTHLEGEFIIGWLTVAHGLRAIDELRSHSQTRRLAFLLLLVGFTTHDDGDVSDFHELLVGVFLEYLAEVLLSVSVVNENVNVSGALSSGYLSEAKGLLLPS